MKHTLDELLDIVYRHYPRGIGISNDNDIQARIETEEHARLVSARRKAAADERWHAMRRRISERFPDAPLMNHSLHLPAGGWDACYSFTISPPEVTGHQELWFQVSFLAPYYIIYSSRLLESDVVAPLRGFNFVLHGVQFHIPRSAVSPELMLNLGDESMKSVTIKQRDVTVAFDLSPDERPYAQWIAREIGTTFGCERMPPEVGTVLVPDVTANLRLPGEVRLYDCLFSDSHEWVKPPPSEVQATSVEVDTSRLTDRFIAIATVLAALYQIAWTVLPEMQGACYWVVSTDGVLHKKKALKELAKLRPLIESPVTPRGIAERRELEAATRELEALIAAWDGEGAPPDAMVAWASGFLASWIADENSK